ncbi:unnamed protein product [Hyaloperonospora brassicae]|uniref:Galactosyltransferase N-terminal domain-containing protein n=1 Tax=Hyaloperonospora brassicae TaxID=162125 RepID=A0AAV0TB66_HYABA|nr:unnamed protein product [Hyaloperonospora brassicae]
MSDSTRVAVLVPFRDTHPTQQRRTHLDAFVPYMTDFLRRHCAATSASFHLFILEQSLDGRKFNRGKLLNAGFDMACTDYDVYIFHDVDLLPADSLNAWYTTVPHHGPVHIARVWDRYRGSPTYFGDDELYCRVVHKHLTVQAPTSGAVRDLEEMNLNEKLAVLRANKWKCTVKRELLKEHRQTWQKNGLKGLHYEYVDAEALNEHCTKITVHLGPNGHWSDSRSSLETSPAMASCPASTSAVVPRRSPTDVGNDETTATVDTTGTASTHVP